MNRKIIPIITTAAIAATSFAPSLPALAATNSRKAITKYKSILSKSDYKWTKDTSWNPDVNKTKNYRFAVYDVNGDGVKELFLNNTAAASADGYVSVLTCKNGKIKKLAPDMDYIVYKKSGIVQASYGHMGVERDTYYQLKNGKWVKKASGIQTDNNQLGEDSSKVLYKGKDYSYTECKVAGRDVSYKKYSSYLKKLLKHDTKTVKLKYYKNTAANRSKYLK